MSHFTAPAIPPRSPLRPRPVSLPPRPDAIDARGNLLKEPPSEAETVAIKGEKVRAELRALFDSRVPAQVDPESSSSSTYPRVRQVSTSSSDVPLLRRTVSLSLADNAKYHSGLRRLSELRSSSTDVSPLFPAMSLDAPERVHLGAGSKMKDSDTTHLPNPRPITRKQPTPSLYLRRAKSALHTQRRMVRKWFKRFLRRDKTATVPPSKAHGGSSHDIKRIPALAKRLSLFSLRSRKREGCGQVDVYGPSWQGKSCP